jgi:hypothetical protein
MFASLAAAKAAAREFFASELRAAAVYYVVNGAEVRIARAEVAGR